MSADSNFSTTLRAYFDDEEGDEQHDNSTHVLGFSAESDVFPIVLAILIIALNSLVIILVIKHKQLRSTTNYLLCSLALSDLMTGLLSIPLFISCNIIQEITICITAEVVLRFTSISTVLHLLAITMDRYMAIMHSLRYYNIVTSYRGGIVIISTWAVSIAVAVVQLAWNNPSVVDNTYDEPPEILKQHEIRYDIFNLVFFFCLPLLTMIFVNSRIFYEVVRQTKAMKKNFPGWVNAKNTSRREWKAAVTFAVMFIVFIACWCPYFLMRLQHNLGEEIMFVMTLLAEYILIHMRFLTSLLNPCIYILGKTDFRKALGGRRRNRAASFSKASGTKYTGIKSTTV